MATQSVGVLGGWGFVGGFFKFINIPTPHLHDNQWWYGIMVFYLQNYMLNKLKLSVRSYQHADQ